MSCPFCGRYKQWHGSEDGPSEDGCHGGVLMDDDEAAEGWQEDTIYPPCPHNPARCMSCNGTGWAADPEAAEQDDCPDCVGGWADGKTFVLSVREQSAPPPPPDAAPPYDPTAEMLAAGVAALRDGDLTTDAARVGQVWRAMCAVAGVSDGSDAVPREVADGTPMRCSECGWVGHADECGPEGECGNGCPGSSVSEITNPVDMIEAWQDSEGTMCGKELADAGLIEPHPATAEEASRLELNPGDSVWDLTEAGQALSAARAAGLLEGKP